MCIGDFNCAREFWGFQGGSVLYGWQDVQSNTLGRAEILLASWTEAEQEATDERERTEDLLAALETISQRVRAPPPVPPPKPEFRPVVEAPVLEAIPPTEPDTGRPASGGEQSGVLGSEAVQLAYNLVEETQTVRSRESFGTRTT